MPTNLINSLSKSTPKIKAVIILTFLVVFFQSCKNDNSHSKSNADKPNILFIIADDLGYEKLGCFGGLNVSTPNLDELASKGVMFERTYGSPVCTPSRMSIYTGSYTPRHKHTTVLPVHEGTKQFVDFENRFYCYAKAFQNEGYQTSVTGKWQLATLEYHPDHCQTAGFDSWCVWQIWKEGAKTVRYWGPTLNQDGKILPATENDFGPDMLTEYVIARMKKAKEDGEPFLIHHNMMLPHVPIVKTPDDIKNGTEATLDHMITYADKQVGIVLKALKELGLEDNTYVFFLGDNGTDMVEPRMTVKGAVTGGKHRLTEGGAHTPLIAYAPGRFPQGKSVSDLIDFADFFPTFCELANIEVPENANPDGISFAKILTKGETGKRTWVTSGYKDDFFVFDGEWRLHFKDHQLYDCRELPKVIKVETETAETVEARKKLIPLVERVEKMEY